MTPYSIALFLHVVGAVLLFATLTLEGIAIRQLRRAGRAEEAAASAAILRLNRGVGPISALLVLVPGVYMTLTSWGWKAWITVGLGAWVLIAVFGAVSGIRTLALERLLARDSGPIRPELAARIGDPLLVASWCTRAGVAVGVVFLMTVKPGLLGAVVAVLIAAAAGLGAGSRGVTWIRSAAGAGVRRAGS